MKITLIGDSIRMQYEEKVRELLGADFEVFAPSENCRFAKYNLRGMWDWKEDMQGSRIVHWNCGLWDICDIFGDGMFTSLDEYVKTVSRVADILLSRHDVVIFATTTPIRIGNPYTLNSDIQKYNEAIVPVLKEKGVIINDLNSLFASEPEKYVSDDFIHLADCAIDIAAEKVAKVILEASKTLSDKAQKSYVIEEKAGAPVKFR